MPSEPVTTNPFVEETDQEPEVLSEPLTRARRLREAGESREAAQAYREAAAAPSASVDTLYETALYLADIGEGEEAVERLAAATAPYPEHKGLVVSRAEILSELEQDPEADTLLSDLQDRFPDYHWATLNRVPVLLRLDRADEAREMAHRVLTAEPAEGQLEHWVRRLGQIARQFSERAMFDIAEPVLKRIVELCPDDGSAFDNLSVLYVQSGRPLDGLRMSVRAMDLLPESPIVYYNLGWALSGLHAAEAAYRKTIELDPDYRDVYNNFGRMLWQMRRPDEAIGMFRQAAERYKDAYSRAELGSHLYESGDYVAAETEARHAEELDSGDPLAQRILGDIAAMEGDWTEARRRFEAALRFSPGWWTAAIRLARLSAFQEERDTFLGDLKQALLCDVAATCRCVQTDAVFEALRDDTDVQALLRAADLFGSAFDVTSGPDA